ncbi:PEP-CTERM sorting domain-containing protein [Nostoc parmelioides]|uniref:PEP-CTERM sorting domain-containing protein n=1 Tax=Nostoc parmelioides FACHB-3921 TaxID=2692909 RepID=A0ABR8BKE1_9NOSO|nr:PEP-CTERM sorting domain-containing protein [Nostoc parmelioides]MBD2253965.1 PEP-CTERM sorting domain-containing protein [Nostoc parmelioides FACHB-3921]
MLKWSSLALVIATAFLITNQEKVHAISINNGSFETGNFSNWETVGSTDINVGITPTVETAEEFGVTPINGTYQAVLETLADTTGINSAALETFLGLSSGSLTSLEAEEGSAIKQVITVNAGDKLTFSWNFLTNQVPADPTYNDFAFFSITGVTQLANTNSLTTFSFSRLAEETGYQPYTYNFTTAGTYTLGFGVVDVGDTTVNSALLVDNVELTPVPEPTTMLGILMGIGFGYAAKMRFSPQQKKANLK